jgi:uncharacterized membrane protein
MTKGRLEAFSDGVLAVIITIMVLELKAPDGDSLEALIPMCTPFFAYVLSFVYVGIYWNNHHHLVHTVKHVNGAIMWANLHLLFWISLFPLLTAWVGHHPTSRWPTAIYGVDLFAAGLAWLILQAAIIRAGGGSLAEAIGSDRKGKISAVLYLAGIGLAFVQTWIADVIFAVVAAIWVVPDRRIEKALAVAEGEPRTSTPAAAGE